ncbi:MAG: hypothetical protein HOV77_16730 [Hamadaea sp.]|uniref:hypothetical protein n=1 Tax=Hamadaea sp. TaxID=2024425 RepID=UPI0018290A50|nr:hypothetical protein [Hamadaea sp.]NUT20827.1 hypothetical protein [Hamadaea sp.]
MTMKAGVHPSFIVHVIVSSLLTLVFAYGAVGASSDRSVEVEAGRPVEAWSFPVILAVATVALALATWSSVRLSAGSPESARSAIRWALRCAVGMIVVGPAVSLVDVRQADSWGVLGIAIYAAAISFVVCGAVIAWQLRHILRFEREATADGTLHP